MVVRAIRDAAIGITDTVNFDGVGSSSFFESSGRRENYESQAQEDRNGFKWVILRTSMLERESVCAANQ